MSLAVVFKSKCYSDFCGHL